MTSVKLNVTTSGPVVLIMKTYEPIHWIINTSRAQVLGILVLGYHTQKVSTDKSIPAIVSYYEGKNDPCHAYGRRYSLIEPRPFMEEHAEESKDYGLSLRKKLDDRAILLTGKKTSKYTYSYTLPPEMEIDDK